MGGEQVAHDVHLRVGALDDGTGPDQSGHPSKWLVPCVPPRPPVPATQRPRRAASAGAPAERKRAVRARSVRAEIEVEEARRPLAFGRPPRAARQQKGRVDPMPEARDRSVGCETTPAWPAIASARPTLRERRRDARAEHSRVAAAELTLNAITLRRLASDSVASESARGQEGALLSTSARIPLGRLVWSDPRASRCWSHPSAVAPYASSRPSLSRRQRGSSSAARCHPRVWPGRESHRRLETGRSPPELTARVSVRGDADEHNAPRAAAGACSNNPWTTGASVQ